MILIDAFMFQLIIIIYIYIYTLDTDLFSLSMNTIIAPVQSLKDPPKKLIPFSLACAKFSGPVVGVFIHTPVIDG